MSEVSDEFAPVRERNGTQADVLWLDTAGGCQITTTVTNGGGHVTCDSVHRGGQVVCVNLTEAETKALISNLVASLNAYQRGAA